MYDWLSIKRHQCWNQPLLALSTNQVMKQNLLCEAVLFGFPDFVRCLTHISLLRHQADETSSVVSQDWGKEFHKGSSPNMERASAKISSHSFLCLWLINIWRQIRI